jgi:heme-degrading monooxygenase HmoA
MYAAFSQLQVVASRIDDYVTCRRQFHNPAMSKIHGFSGTILLRNGINKEADTAQVALVNFWMDREAQRDFAASPMVPELNQRVKDLVMGASDDMCEVRGISPVVGRNDIGAAAVLSIMRVDSRRTEEYLHQWDEIVRPLCEEAQGYLGSTQLVFISDPQLVSVINHLENHEAAEALAGSLSTAEERYAKLNDLVEASLTIGQYEVILS